MEHYRNEIKDLGTAEIETFLNRVPGGRVTLWGRQEIIYDPVVVVPEMKKAFALLPEGREAVFSIKGNTLLPNKIIRSNDLMTGILELNSSMTSNEPCYYEHIKNVHIMETELSVYA